MTYEQLISEERAEAIDAEIERILADDYEVAEAIRGAEMTLAVGYAAGNIEKTIYDLVTVAARDNVDNRGDEEDGE